MKGKLKTMEKFLRIGNLKKRPCYKSPKIEINSYAFKHLIHNIKSYNRVKI